MGRCRETNCTGSTRTHFEARVYGFDVAGTRLSFAFDLTHFNGDEVATGGAPIVVEDDVGVSGKRSRSGRSREADTRLRFSTAPAPPATSDRS